MYPPFDTVQHPVVCPCLSLRFVHSLAPYLPSKFAWRSRRRRCRHVWAAPEAPPAFRVIVLLTFLSYGLQLYWFRKIVVGAYRVLARAQNVSYKTG